MKLTSPSNVKALLSELDMHPSRNLGQNFLVDENILRIILDAADIKDTDRVLEIGPGLGVLTERLIETTKHVTSVEIDNRLSAHLRSRFGDKDNFELIESDILDLDPAEIYGNGVTKLVANLPYSISSHAMMDMAMQESCPDRAVVTVQREVAERFAANPGTKAYGLPSVWIQAAYECTLHKNVSRTCFWPVPRIDSAVVKMVRAEKRAPAGRERELFYLLSKEAFQHRRKQMNTILVHGTVISDIDSDRAGKLLSDAGIENNARPGDVSSSDWVRLATVCAAQS